MNTVVVIAGILMVLGGGISLANWSSLYWSYHTKRFHSTVPFGGAALLGVGMFILPATQPYCWSAVILDYGTLAFLIGLLRLVREQWSTSNFNLLSEYVGRSGRKTVHLRLFRRGVFTLRIGFQLVPGECGCTSSGTTGKWENNANRLLLENFQKESATLDFVQSVSTETLHQSVGFPSLENTPVLSLADIQFVLAKGRAIAFRT